MCVSQLKHLFYVYVCVYLYIYVCVYVCAHACVCVLPDQWTKEEEEQLLYEE